MELDAKILHCDKMTEERDELRQKFEEAILDVQQKSSMTTVSNVRDPNDSFIYLQASEAHCWNGS